MNKKKFTKLLALYLPYLVIGLAATNLGESWRLAEGKELGDKIVSLIDTLPAAFANPLPSLHPLDILVGICCGAGLRLAVYLKSKNPRLHTDEVLIALSASAATNPDARLALQQLSKLNGCQAHTSVMLSDVDIRTFKRLGVQLTCEAVYETGYNYH